MKKMFFITIISMFLFNVSDVFAEIIVYPQLTGSYSTNVRWLEYGHDNSVVKVYTDNFKIIPLNGNEYPAFCVDPGLSLRSGTKYSCEATTDAGLVYLMNQYKSGGDYTTVQLAFRFYAGFIGLGSSELSGMKAAVIRFRQIKEGKADTMIAACAAVGMVCSDNPYDYLAGDNALVERAYAMAEQALDARSNSATGVSQSSTTVYFTKTVDTPESITYTLRSSNPIQTMEFDCEGCTITSSSWAGTGGTVTVTPNPDCEEFDIKLFYAPSGVQVCRRSPYSSDHQWLITEFEITGEGGLDLSQPTQIYTDKGAGCKEECCPPDLLSDYMVGDINNCCYESTHSFVKQYELDELFCEDVDLRIPLFKDRCKNDYYVDQDAQAYLNDYCQIYCTERVTIDTPGAVTAVSGRYFTLTTNSAAPGGFQTTSPYVFGVKRCRMKVHYDKWEEDYYAAVDAEIKQYNTFQENKAYELIYKETIDNNTESLTAHLTAECKAFFDGDIDPDCSAPSISAPTLPTPFDEYVDYKLYYFVPGLELYPRYYWVQTKDDNLERTNHKMIKLEDDKVSHLTDHARYSEWNLKPRIDAMNEWISSNTKTEVNKATNSCTVTNSTTNQQETVTSSVWYDIKCERTSAKEKAELVDARNENVEENYKKYADNAAQANDAYNAATEQAKLLEEQIDKCDYFFEAYEGTNAQMMYGFSPSLSFSYDQIYLDEYGKKKKDNIYINFVEEPGCVIEGPIIGDDEDINGKVFSPVYNLPEEINKVQDFASKTLEFVDNTVGFKTYEDELYEASKVFTHDAKYVVNCAWSESDDQVKTLVPSGEVHNYAVFNYTSHEKEYKVYITTFDGKYDTKWGLTGIGEDSKFDNFIATNGGATCSGEASTSDKRFTCGLEVSHEIIFVGKCEPDHFTTSSPDNCDKNDDMELFQFKIVDPSNFFPTGTTDSDGNEYAYNWTKTEEGRSVMQAINRKGERENNYAPANISYSFTLTPTDMRHIKNYNTEQNERGGYTDFNLYCDCPDGVQTNSMENGEGCVKCKSVFLDNLEDGFVKYDKTRHNIDVWASPSTLDNLRTRAHWAG